MRFVCVTLTILNCMLLASAQIVSHASPGSNGEYSYGYAGVDSRGPYGGAGGNGRYQLSGIDERGRSYAYGGQGAAPGEPGYNGQPGYMGQPGFNGQLGYAGQPGYPRYPGQYGYSYYGGANTTAISSALLLSMVFLFVHLLWKLM